MYKIWDVYHFNQYLFVDTCIVILISTHIKLSISDKISWDTLSLRGFQMFYWISPWNVVPLFNDGEGGGGVVWILLFSVVTLFEYNVSTILSPIVWIEKVAIHPKENYM